MNSVLLSTYQTFDKIGYISTWVLGITLVLALVFVMVKYLNTSDLND